MTELNQTPRPTHLIRKSKERPIEIYLVLLVFAFCLILIAGFRPIGFDRDSLKYLELYRDYSSFGTANFIQQEPSFWAIVYLSKLVSNESIRPLFLVYAFLEIAITTFAINKLTPYPLSALICFAFLFFPLHTMTQIRVGVACAIFLLTIPDIVNRRPISFLLKSTLAMAFHYSAIVIFFAYFIKSKNINTKFYLVLPLVGLFFPLYSYFYDNDLIISAVNSSASFMPIILGNKIQTYIALLNMGTGEKINLFSFYYIGILFVYYVTIFNWHKFNSKYDLVFIKLLGWTLFVYYSMSFLPVISFRISEIIGITIIFILPSLMYRFKQKMLIKLSVSLYVLTVFVDNVFVHHLFNI